MKKICKHCSKEYEAIRKDQKYCSKDCYYPNSLEQMRARHRRTYRCKGYNQSGKNNNNWRSGIGIYRKLIKINYCVKCNSLKNLLVHHIDENRKNNEPKNLKVLCKRCHQIEHGCAQHLPKGRKLAAQSRAFAKNRKRNNKGQFI